MREIKIWIDHDTRYAEYDDGEIGYSGAYYDAGDGDIHLISGYNATDEHPAVDFSCVVTVAEAQWIIHALSAAVYNQVVNP